MFDNVLSRFYKNRYLSDKQEIASFKYGTNANVGNRSPKGANSKNSLEMKFICRPIPEITSKWRKIIRKKRTGDTSLVLQNKTYHVHGNIVVGTARTTGMAVLFF